MKIPIFVKKEDLLPTYATKEAAGADLKADMEEDFLLFPGKSARIPTGLYMELPEGYEAQIRPRSGLALHHQITILNTPGTVDADFRGEIQVILINHGKNVFVVKPRMRIAQLVIAKIWKVEFVQQEKTTLKISKRGTKGFGHTGTN